MDHVYPPVFHSIDMESEPFYWTNHGCQVFHIYVSHSLPSHTVSGGSAGWAVAANGPGTGSAERWEISPGWGFVVGIWKMMDLTIKTCDFTMKKMNWTRFAFFHQKKWFYNEKNDFSKIFAFFHQKKKCVFTMKKWV